MKNLLLVLPVAVAAPVSPRCVGSACGAGGSLVTRPVAVGVTSGRLRGLRTKEGVASSSSTSSSVILTSRRRFGAWLVSAGSAPVGDGSTAIGLFPVTLSSVVGAGRGGSVPPHCWCIEDTEQHRLPAGPSPGASDTYTAHRSMSPICNGTNDKSSTRRKQYSHGNTSQ